MFGDELIKKRPRGSHRTELLIERHELVLGFQGVAVYFRKKQDAFVCLFKLFLLQSQEDCISLMAPVGAALLGLSVDDVFAWEIQGKPRSVKVLEIRG